jgi:hypothetical protein
LFKRTDGASEPRELYEAASETRRHGLGAGERSHGRAPTRSCHLSASEVIAARTRTTSRIVVLVSSARQADGQRGTGRSRSDSACEGKHPRHRPGALPARDEPLSSRYLAGERAREAAAGTSGTDPIPTDAEIVAALRRKAEKGDAAAARELREWRTLESSATQGDLWMELLTPRERQFVRRVIERALKRTGDPITPDR